MLDISPRERIIVALDCDGDQARRLANRLEGRATWLKIGMTLFYREGPGIVREFRDRGFKVFVDLKLHDIPHQAEGAARSIVEIGADMMTLHASGGLDMMKAAVDAVAAGSTSADKPIVLAVTVLTSTDDAMLEAIGVGRPMLEQVKSLAQLADRAGCDGVVCSPKEAEMLRGVLGPQAAVVTPGVRPLWAIKGDQSRVATPAKALAAGASHLVIGRPICQAEDPAVAFDRIVEEIEQAE